MAYGFRHGLQRWPPAGGTVNGLRHGLRVLQYGVAARGTADGLQGSAAWPFYRREVPFSSVLTASTVATRPAWQPAGFHFFLNCAGRRSEDGCLRLQVESIDELIEKLKSDKGLL